MSETIIRLITTIIIHCSATPPSMDIGAADIDRWHRLDGYFKIGYHYVIRRDGTVETGRPLNRAGAHARGHNHDSIGIVLVGGVDEEFIAEKNFTEEQLNVLHDLITDLQLTIYRQQTRMVDIIGHRDLPGVAKDCPSMDIEAWLEKQDGGDLPPEKLHQWKTIRFKK